jgi:hypothetical protein
MSYIICRFCHIRHIQSYTTSWEVGCCRVCAHEHLPSYIPENQWKLYLDKLHRKIHDTEKRFTERDKKILQT